MSIRKPEQVEYLYLDFDGFFASVEQQAKPRLRGKPVGVVPFDTTDFTSVIACSKEAKARGVKNVMPIREAKKLCHDLILVPQSPDLYRRAHLALVNEISSVIPIEAIKSIDELACKLDRGDQKDPIKTARKIKECIHDNIGSHITCSIGLAANRHLAKIACKMDKPNGITIWRPEDMPTPLLSVPFDDIAGIGEAMKRRLFNAGIFTTKQLLETSPKQMRHLWRNVTGERLWYALHGYEVKALPSKRGMFGHSRVLPPESRNKTEAKACARLLLVKAARRMRREGYFATKLWLHFSLKLNPQLTRSYSGELSFPSAQDDQACLTALNQLWEQTISLMPRYGRILRIGVSLYNLERASGRQLDLFVNDDELRRKWESINRAVDQLNIKYGKTIVSIGSWKPPEGGYAGGKIAYTRIPSAEDFW
jgi:DNA polymerase-4